MNWKHSEDNWAQFTANVSERWGDLTDRQLAVKLQETYGVIDGEDGVQRHLTDWEQRLSEIERTGQ